MEGARFNLFEESGAIGRKLSSIWVNRISFRRETSSIDEIEYRVPQKVPIRGGSTNVKQTQLNNSRIKLVIVFEAELEKNSPIKIKIETCNAKMPAIPKILSQSSVLKGSFPERWMVSRFIRIPIESGSRSVKNAPRYLPNST